MAFTVASVNVNGIRAAIRKGMHGFLEQSQPDIITLQEVRAPDEVLRELLGEGWFIAHSECASKGRAGVAIASRSSQISSTEGLFHPPGSFNDSGRWVEAVVESPRGIPITVISAYVHTGDSSDDVRMAEKLTFMDAIIDRVSTLRNEGAHVLLTGDLNVAHREMDIRNWKGNIGKAGFREDERARLDRLMLELGWVDLGRALVGDMEGPYTWWTYRGRAFDNDVGWRIDYQIASPELAESAKDVLVHRVGSHEERWSDHAPVSVTFDI